MAKKHCPKHASYYYRCPDCRRLNAEPATGAPAGTPADTGRRLYPDAFDETGTVRIPVEGQEIPITPGRPRQVKSDRTPPGGRYYGGYKKAPKNRRKITIIGLILGAIAVFAILIWAYPAWYGGISLNQQLYMSKAGSFDFWQFYTLNGWSSQFFFNKIGLVSGLIGMLFMILPIPDRAVLSFIGDWRGRPNPSRAKCYLFWAPVGFGIFYVVGQLMDVWGMFGWGAYLVEQGNISGDIATVGNALQVLFNPGAIDTSFMSTIFAYQYFWLPIINLIFACIILRVVLAMIEYRGLKQNYILTVAYGVILVGIIFGVTLFNLPLTGIDGLNQVQNWSVVLGFVGFLVLGVFLLIYGKVRHSILSFDKKLGKKTIVIAAATLVIIAIPLLISIPTAIGIDQDESTWTTERWNKKILNEIEWTNVAAGTDVIVRNPMTDLISGELNKTKDEDLLASMRLFDKTYAFKKMLPQTKTEETLADADIVYLDGVEYWVAPKTVDWVELSASSTPGAVQLHTNLYDHVEGFYAMDTRSNEILDGPQTQSTFNVSAAYPIFFGENQATETLPSDSSGETLFGESSVDVTWAYDQDLILSTEWGNTSISGYSSNWTTSGGTPDGSLTGLERFWYTTNMGLFSYAISQSESTYLINRNVMTRVKAILYPGLTADPDAYLVFDKNEGRLFYAVSIYVDMPIRSFSQSNIMRFLGACLVDVKTGTLRFYTNPQYSTSPTSDPTWNFWKIYYDLYSWQTAPSWFTPQFRYPEDLAEAQLKVDYKYHVNNPTNWRRNDAWYQRPTNGDLYYIETDLGSGMEFVAVDLVERYGGDTKLMAGLYAIRHGANFGQLVFYDASYLAADPIGPETATTLLTNTATSELTLIGANNRRDGNVLLYPLAGSVYYLIPVYWTATTGTSIDELKIVGLVNATDRKIEYGSGAGDLLLTSFNAFNISYEATALSNVSLTSTLESTAYWNATSTTDDDYAQLQFAINYADLGEIYDQANVTVNITVHSEIAIVKQYGQIVTQNASFIHGPDTYWNYTVAQWENLFPGEGRTSLVKINANITSMGYSVLIYYDITMYVQNKYGTVTVYDTRVHSLTIINQGQT